MFFFEIVNSQFFTILKKNVYGQNDTWVLLQHKFITQLGLSQDLKQNSNIFLSWKWTWDFIHRFFKYLKREMDELSTPFIYILTLSFISYKLINVMLCIIFLKLSYLVEVGMRPQNAIWILRVPRGIILNTFKVKIFFSP
jgi:hypothetical protein